MSPGPFMQISFPLPKNAPQTVVTLIGQAVSENKIMERINTGLPTSDPMTPIYA